LVKGPIEQTIVSPDSRAKIKLLRTIGFATIEAIQTLDYFEEMYAIFSLPIEKQIKLLEIFYAKNDTRFFRYGMAINNIGVFNRAFEMKLRVLINVDIANITLAIEQYRLVTGILPDDLASLVPNFLAEVPIDLYAGKPFLYKILKDGYIVWSVGSDKINNNGKALDIDGRKYSKGTDQIYKVIGKEEKE